MTSASLDHSVDLEAQRDVLDPSGLGGSGTYGMSIPPSTFATKSNATLPDQDTNIEVHPVLSQDAVGCGGSTIHEKKVDQSEQDSRATNLPTQVGKDGIQIDQQTRAESGVNSRIPATEHPSGDTGPPGSIFDSQSEEKRMIGDFDGSAHTFWTLYGKEAKSHDEARIQTLKEDMDGVLIFAGLFSAAVTPFIIESKKSLKADPADQTVYYLQQHLAILEQISRQLTSIAPQVSINSTPSSAFPAFKPSASVC